MVKREREREVSIIAGDRDAYERLYRGEKARREQLEAEVKQLREAITEDGKLVGAYEREVRGLERTVKRQEKQILELLGQKSLLPK